MKISTTLVDTVEKPTMKIYLPGTAWGPRLRSSGCSMLFRSQLSRMILASRAASTTVQSASTKYPSRSFNVTKSGAPRKESRSTARLPQSAASARIRAFWRTHDDRADVALTIVDVYERSRLRAGSRRFEVG